MIRRTIVALAFLASASGAAPAGEIADLARDAEAKANVGQHIEAVETLRRAINSLMAKGPLTLRRVQFIAEPPKGFGIYQPRANNVFRPGEPLIAQRMEKFSVARRISAASNSPVMIRTRRS